MTRISSFGQQQLLLRGITENQGRLFEAQRQITTGKKSDDFKGLAGNTSTVLGAKSFQGRVETYQQTIDTIRGKLDANDVQVGGMLNSVRSLQDNMRGALANRQAEGFGDMLDQSFKFVVNSMNTNFDGTYLFSGAKSGAKPVNIETLADLSALPAVSDAFDNASLSFEAKIADGVNLEFGLLASDVGEEVFGIMKELYDFNQSTPMQGELTDAQWDFLQSKMVDMGTAIDNMQQVQVRNGLAFERLEVVDEQHEDTKVYLETFIADMEDVDIAEAISRLNNDQLALEASYQAVGALSRLSLLNFL